MPTRRTQIRLYFPFRLAVPRVLRVDSPRMRARLPSWALIAVATCTVCFAKEGAEVAVSRSYSAMYFMRTVCPRHITIDVDFATRTSEAILARGNRELDKAAMMAAIIPEMERRRAEVAAAGEAAWCKSQRALMREIGLGKVFGE